MKPPKLNQPSLSCRDRGRALRSAMPRVSAIALLVGLASGLVSIPLPARAEAVDMTHVADGSEIAGYVSEDVMIPMRDGVKLHALVLRPKGSAGKLPILMERSPYGFSLPDVRHMFDNSLKELSQEQFIFVLEDIRGRFGSEGKFVMLSPAAKTAKDIDESTDTYDTIDWLVKALPNNNGSVGIFGVSYGGWTTAMATVNPHPALKAVSVQASPEDVYIGDDFFHNGAFRVDYAWEYTVAVESDDRTLRPFEFGSTDPYDWYLKQKKLADLDKETMGRTLPTWQTFVQHPNYDAFWQAQVTSKRMPAKPGVPNLVVAGFWDQEDYYGAITIYQRQEKQDVDHKNYLVLGPWNHGGWSEGTGDHYGPFDNGTATSTYFRSKVETPWFRYWLKGKGTLDEPEALVFESGSNQWKRYDTWPPKSTTPPANLYLHANGKLSFDPPAPSEGQADHFVSDPANPVPYRPRPIDPFLSGNSTWPLWLADDQSSFAKRSDVLSWETEPLNADVAIVGDVAAKLFASTTGSDADWIVKLIDVYPDDDGTPADLRGRQRIVTDEVFRGRFRAGFDHPQALMPGKVLDYAIDMHDASYVFKKGHRIAVQVQSTWFPLIDRNPQTFEPSIFEAKPADYQAQTHTVFHSVEYPSSIAVSVLPGKGTGE